MHRRLLDHPAYSPHLAPSDYFLFRNLKSHLRGVWYPDDEVLKEAVKAWLEGQTEDSILVELTVCQTRSSAMAEGLHDALVSIDYCSGPIVWHYLRNTFSHFDKIWSVTDTHTHTQTDGQTHDDGIYGA